ncbi:member of the major facilitator superfamily [Phlegmacium glaucopus]|nr:member of the major facilitator superfamily [Phlegmacium glaucopus]
MAAERSPLLQNGEEHGGQTDYLATANEAEQVAVNGVTDAEQQTVVAPQNSLLALVIPMAIGIFLCAMDQTIIVASYAAIGSELNELQNTSWIATSYLLTTTSIQPLYGKLSDIFGRKTCLLFAYTVFAVGCLLCGLSRNMAELVASRALSGIGGGGMQTIVSIIVSDVVPLRSRGTWQGVLNIVFATGSTVGASLGGFLADTIGWRWAFLLQVPVTVAAIVSVTLALHLPKVEASDLKAKLKRVDWAGAVSLILTVFFLLFALDRGGNVSWNDRLTIYSLTALPICFIAFASIEMKFASEPFAPKRIIVNRTLIASYLVNFFGIASGFTLLFYLPLYLQAVLGQTASQAGLWLLIGVFTGLFGSLGSGLIMQATGKYYQLTVISYMSLLLGTVIVNLSTGIIISSTIGMVTGNGVTSSLISLIANAGQEDQAIATAVSYLFRSLGSVIGLSVGSTLVQGTLRSALHRKLSGANVEEIIRKVRESLTYIEKLDPPTQAAVRGSYREAIHATFWFSATMALFSLISSLFIKEKALANRK